MFIKPRCQCSICLDEAPETEDRKKFNCLYSDIEPFVSSLYSKYKLFIKEGNTSLLDLPYQYYQVASFYSHYQNIKDSLLYKKEEQEKVMKELMKSAPKSK